jgi:hypothetical protein
VPEPIHIIYRTRTDRLNLAGAKLPNVSIAELRIDFPHHQYKAAVCGAVVKTTPCSATATPFPERGMSAITSIVSGDASAASVPPSASWSGDVALWEVEAIVAMLEKLNFFKKQRTVLGAEVFLSVETAKHAVGKRYRPVGELDAMIVRLTSQGPALDMSADGSGAPRAMQAQRAELTRLPSFY